MVPTPLNARVLCLQGSLSTPSRTGTLVELARRILLQRGAEVDVLDLGQTRLPQVDPAYHGRSGEHPDPAVRDLVHRTRAAHALLWASPVYHNSYSGVLKNAIDHLSIADVREKPIALCGNGGRRASPQPSDHLRTVARALHGIAIPLVVTTANGDFVARDGQFLVGARELVRRTSDMCDQLLDYTARFAREPSAAPRVPAGSSVGSPVGSSAGSSAGIEGTKE